MVVRDDGRQVEAHVSRIVKLAHLAVGAEQQLTAALQSAFRPQFAEVSYSPWLAIDPCHEFETAARPNDMARIPATGEHQLVTVARDAGGVKSIRLAFQ